jgi:hypothetical protein
MVVFCVKCSFGGFNTKGTKDFEGSVWKLCKQKANSDGNCLGWLFEFRTQSQETFAELGQFKTLI